MIAGVPGWYRDLGFQENRIALDPYMAQTSSLFARRGLNLLLVLIETAYRCDFGNLAWSG
jgi:hypothetical protein